MSSQRHNPGPPINPPRIFPVPPNFGPLPPGYTANYHLTRYEAIQPTIQDYREAVAYLIDELRQYRLRYGFLEDKPPGLARRLDDQFDIVFQGRLNDTYPQRPRGPFDGVGFGRNPGAPPPPFDLEATRRRLFGPH